MQFNRGLRELILIGICGGLLSGCAKKEEPEFATYSVVQVARHMLPESPGVSGSINQEIVFGSEVNTLVSTARTYDLAKRYWAALEREGLGERIAEPYLGSRTYSAELGFSIFAKRMDIQPERLSMLVRFGFTHRDPEVARLVADRIAIEYLAYEKESEAHEKQPIRSRFVSHAFPPQK